MIKFAFSAEQLNSIVSGHKLRTAQVSLTSGGKDIAIRNIAQADSIIEFWDRRIKKFLIEGMLYKQRTLKEAENPLNQINSVFAVDHKQQTKGVDEKVGKLKEYLDYNGSLWVENHLINSLGVKTVIVTDYSLPFTPGFLNQKYSITCISDYATD